MGVQFDIDQFATDDARSMAKRLAGHLGVSEAFITEEALRTQMECFGMIPARDEGTRRAVILAEHLRRKREALPPEQRAEREREVARRMEAIRDIQRRVAELPVLDPRPIEEIMRDIYDEDGIPK